MSSPSSSNNLSMSRGWLIIGGILSLVVGFAAISLPFLFSLLLVQLLAAFALASGAIALFLAIFGKHSEHRILDTLSALVRIATGVAMLICMTSSVLVITLIFAIFLFIEGLMLCVGAIRMKNHPGWVWTFISGLASLVLALMVYRHWPSDSVWVLGLFFGINLIFNSAALLALGLSAPKASAA